jgi:hypothetical protein
VDVDDEILRRIEKIEETLKGIVSLELARDKRVGKLVASVASMIEEDRIAAEVAERLKEHRGQLWSRPVKVAGFVATLAAVGGFLLQLGRLAHG